MILESNDTPVHAHGQAALLGRVQALAARRLCASVEALVRHLSHELLQRLGLDLLLQLGGGSRCRTSKIVTKDERALSTICDLVSGDCCS